jgi:hypothetical protein
MVERRLLTPQLIDSVSPPARGERWIADTKIKGFGLRLWSSPSGQQKALGIRVADQTGKPTRKTFAHREIWDWEFDRPASLGESLEDAREWAQEEIDKFKGRQTLRSENAARWKQASNRVTKLTLGRAAESLISGMKANGLSEQYVNRIDKLFHLIIPAKLKNQPLSRVSAKSVAKALVKQQIPAGNIRTLRSFIGQIFETGARFHGPLLRFREEMSTEFWKEWERHYDVAFPELRDLTEDHYRKIFEKLEAETVRWQQALCIRLYFEFGAPLSRVMSARWEQVLGQHWYPYWPDEKIWWFECRETISEKSRILIDRVSELSQHSGANSSFWFPSVRGHITTVDSFWRHTLNACDSRYYPLREFARSHRDLNNPSYYVSFLRQYGETFRRAQNMAKMSKILEQRRNTIIKSR